MQFMDKYFDPLLYFSADRIFPKVFQIGYDPPSVGYNAVTYGNEDFFIRIIYQMEQGFDFFVFLHGWDIFLLP